MKIRDFILSHFVNYESANSLAFKLRQKRAERIISLIDLYWRKNGSVKIIDVGGSGVYWKIMSREFLINRNVHVTVLILPSEEPLPEDDRVFSFVTGDGCDLSRYSDYEFDIAHSNSVIEHVGEEYRAESFASESERVGKTCYLQTPNFWFPVEPHFLVPFFNWLPLSLRARLLTIFNLGQFSRVKLLREAIKLVSSIKLLTARRLHRLFPGATFYREKFMFLQSLL